MGRKRLTQEEFVQRAKAKHGDKYDYSKVEYKSIFVPVDIICPQGHTFQQTPHDHLKGNGCGICYGHYTLTKEEFIRRARQVHGWKYDYSKVEYVNNRTEVTIICPIHDEFKQTPDSHMSGRECQKCGRIKAAQNKKYTLEEFIQKANKAHNNKYDYSLVDYKGCYEPVKIICPEHDIFEQTPYTHVYGVGCPYCKESHGEKEIAKWLDYRDIEYLRQFKIQPKQLSLIGINVFYIDFYLPKYNIAIEFNGEQHYKKIDFFHRTDDDFNAQLNRDRRLKECCKSNGIKLIVIPYTKIDEIPKILSRKIK